MSLPLKLTTQISVNIHLKHFLAEVSEQSTGESTYPFLWTESVILKNVLLTN